MGAEIVRGNLRFVAAVSLAYQPQPVAAQSDSNEVVNLPGVLPGDIIIAQKPTFTQGFGCVNAQVSAPDTLQLYFENPTLSQSAPPLENWIFIVMRPEDTPLPNRVSQ